MGSRQSDDGIRKTEVNDRLFHLLLGVPEVWLLTSPLGLIGLACTARSAEMSAAEGRTMS
jgi:hypothetical protein